MRWNRKEKDALLQVRRRLKNELNCRPQFPEVVGDRRLLRFLRGKQHNIDKATEMIAAFLKWRDSNGVDKIRQDIVYGGKDTPFKFPKGKIIIDLAPQIIISAHATDKKGQPLAYESYDFVPKDIFKAITIKDYLIFLTYTLEYRAIVLEQISHIREQEYLRAHPNPQDREHGYGVILLDCTIRDLTGIGLAHLGSQGRQLVSAALELGLPNYEEYLGKCHMVNVPWLFNSMWFFVKGMLDQETIDKISLCGSNYMDTLLKDLPFESIPERLGGGFKLYNEPYLFDTSIGGPLHCPPYPDNNNSSSSSSSSSDDIVNCNKGHTATSSAGAGASHSPSNKTKASIASSPTIATSSLPTAAAAAGGGGVSTKMSADSRASVKQVAISVREHTLPSNGTHNTVSPQQPQQTHRATPSAQSHKRSNSPDVDAAVAVAVANGEKSISSPSSNNSSSNSNSNSSNSRLPSFVQWVQYITREVQGAGSTVLALMWERPLSGCVLSAVVVLLVTHHPQTLYFLIAPIVVLLLISYMDLIEM